MMGAMAVPPGGILPPKPEEVGRWLLESTLTTIMVVDDLLDPPQWDALPEDNRNEFVADVDRNEELAAWLVSESLSPPTSVASSDSESYLERLRPRLNDGPGLRELWDKYVTPVYSVAGEVQDLVSDLQALNGLTVIPCGVQRRPALPANVSVIFIDYRLDPTDPDASIDELKRIYKELGDAPPPVVVLMSSQSQLTPAQKERFRDETNTMPGMFYGLQKSQLRGTGLYRILGTIARTLPNAWALQSFRNAVAAATKSAAERVAALVKELTLEDHALIQLLSLNGDGHSLGDYVIWLLSAYFAQQLAQDEAVRKTQEHVDRMVFESPPMIHWGPSNAFVKTYQAAVFASADEDVTVDRYPALTPEAAKESGDAASIVVLHFGDVFVEEQTQIAYMVATPECDLAFGGSRPFPGDRSVVLIPGRLTRADVPFEKGTEDRARTELFEWEGKRWRIEWRLKQARTMSLREIKTWVEAEGARRQRVTQIRFPFAADIQRAYAADLTRVGIPVTPPLFQSFRATLYVGTAGQKPVAICDTISEGGYIFTSPRYRKCVLSDDLLQTLLAALPSAIERTVEMPTQDELERIPGEQNRVKFLKGCEDRARKNAKELKKLAGDLPTLMLLGSPYELAEPEGPHKVSSWLTITDRRPTRKYEAQTVLTVYFEAAEISVATSLNSEEGDKTLENTPTDGDQLSNGTSTPLPSSGEMVSPT